MDDLSAEERALFERLKKYDVPEPDSQRLLAVLRPVMVKPARVKAREWLRLAGMQVALLEAPFWWSSILLIALGLLVVASSGGDTAAVLLVLVSPLVAAGGTAYIFRPATRTLWELEQLSRVHPLELLYARLALILAFNIALALVLLIAAWSQGLQIVLWRLLLIWFGPMIGLTGLALFLSVRWNVIAGSVVPLVLWSVFIVIGLQETVINTPLEMNGLNRIIVTASGSNLLLITALAALIGGIALFYLSGRSVMDEQWR